MSARNLLTEEEQSFSTSSALWVPKNAVATTISRSVVRYNSEPASLLMSTPNGSQMAVRLDREIQIVPNKTYRMFVSAYSETAGHPFGISTSIYSRNGVKLDTIESYSQTVFGKWTIASTEFTAPESAGTMTLEVIAQSNHNEQNGVVYHSSIWIDDVVVTEWSEYPLNSFARLTQRHFPSYMLELDDEEPGKPLRRFIDVVTSVADDVLSATKGFDYIPEVDGVPGYERSTLVDPSYYPDDLVAKKEWLPWLAQLVGARGVSAGSSGLTPWFWLEQEISTWTGMETQIDIASNPVWEISITEPHFRLGGVVYCKLAAQIGGSDPYFPQVGDVVEVVNDGSFSGSFSVTYSDQANSIIRWEQDGADETASMPGGTVRVSDTSWVEIEGANPLAFDTTAVLAELVRSGATGIYAGSRYAIKAAARAVLDGFDDDMTVTPHGASSLLVTTSKPHSLQVGGFVEIYSCEEVPYSGTYDVLEVVSLTSFTVADPYGTGNDPHVGQTFNGRVTNKKVELVMTGQWTGQLKTTQAQTYALGLVMQAVNLAKPAGVILEHQYTT